MTRDQERAAARRRFEQARVDAACERVRVTATRIARVFLVTMIATPVIGVVDLVVR